MDKNIVREVDPPTLGYGILAGAQFADAYLVTGAGPVPTARSAAEAAFGQSPGWVRILLQIRNVIVKPFGLKTPSTHTLARRNVVGIFPVVSETPERLVAGLDDRHLDFRVVVDVAASESDRHDVTVTTLVLTHNLLGRCYLFVIKPFHRLVVRAMLRQVVTPTP